MAASVTQDADHVTYRTPAGQMSIPKSMVVRIERDDSIFYFPLRTADSAPPVSAPEIEPFAATMTLAASRCTMTTSISLISRAWNRTHGPGCRRVEKFAAAQYSAAQFLVGKGDTDAAIGHYREALHLRSR